MPALMPNCLNVSVCSVSAPADTAPIAQQDAMREAVFFSMML